MACSSLEAPWSCPQPIAHNFFSLLRNHGACVDECDPHDADDHVLQLCHECGCACVGGRGHVGDCGRQRGYEPLSAQLYG